MVRTFLIAAFLCIFCQLHGEEGNSQTWETLKNCRLVQAPLNDGDSFMVDHNGQKYALRIYWVDAPESTSGDLRLLQEQARYFSIPEAQVTDSGQLAKRVTRNFLRGEFTVHTKWEDARGAGSSGKSYYAVFEKDGEYLSQELVAQGLARIYGMPPNDRWPNGPSPRAYLSRLKNSERAAQQDEDGIWGLAKGSIQMSGLQSLIAGSQAGGQGLRTAQQDDRSVVLKNKININTASIGELESLPGIGPILAQRIIDARPIDLIDSLVDIAGISANTLAGFSQMIITEEPPPPEKTIAFYLADLGQYLDQEVVVVVDSIAAVDAVSPSGFKALKLTTAYGGEAGGSITSFIPDEFVDSFTQFYSEPGKEFTGLLYEQENGVVLVYRRK